MITTLLTAAALVLTVGQASADIQLGPGTFVPDGYFRANEKANQICDGFLRAIEKGVDSLELQNSNFQCHSYDLLRYNQILKDKASQLAAIADAARKKQNEAMAAKRTEAIEQQRRADAEARKPIN